jgi:hypothetical protein
VCIYIDTFFVGGHGLSVDMAAFTYSRSPEEMASLSRALHANSRRAALHDMSMSPAHVVDFMDHARSGGGWNEFADAFKHGPQHFFDRAKNEITNKESDLRAKIIPAAVEVANKAAPAINMIAPGAGTALATGANTVNRLNGMGRYGARRTRGYANTTLAGSGKRKHHKHKKAHVRRKHARGSGHNAARNAVMAAALKTVTAQRKGLTKGMVRTKGKHAPLDYALDYIVPAKHVAKKGKGKKSKSKKGSKKGCGFMGELFKAPSATEVVKGLTGMW